VDWKVYAKTDRYYIKQFEEETNLTCHLLLDASASMGYGSKEGRFTKLDYAARMAACLAYFMMGQRDASGLTVFDTRIRSMLPPHLRPSHLQHLLTELEGVKPGGETGIASCLHKIAEGLKRRGLIVLISDLLDDPAAILSALQHFRFQGHDVIVFHIMDPAELHFSFDTLTEFTDLETGTKQLVSPESMRTPYMDELRRFLTSCEKGCAGIKADYKLFNTETPLDLALSEYLHRRSRIG
jgi:uncharacterized protein (DUF58 family)